MNVHIYGAGFVRGAVCVGIGILAAAAAAQENRLRNGSFEGSTKYFMTTGVLDEQNPAHGRYALKLAEKARFRSASFRLEPKKPITISMFARSEKPGQISVSITPSNRQVGQATGWAWSKRQWKAAVGPQWKRVTWTIEIPRVDKQGGFPGSGNWWWNKTSWIMMIGGPKPLWIDGISIAAGKGAAGYVPWAPVEVTATAVNLPGYRPNGNILVAGTPVELQATAFNPGNEEQAVTLRWEVLDYTGAKRFGDAVDKEIKIPPGKTVIEKQTLAPSGKGLMLLRVSAVNARGEMLDSSDQPVTILAFPKAATKPNPAERFGASFRSRHLIECGQKIGLGWSRWYPQMNWSKTQPSGPDDWKWQDKTVEHMHAHGISVNAVLHSIPKWAKAKASKVLPKDMEAWGGKDPKWRDLSIETGWDRFVSESVKHYAGKSIVWEVVNEPDIHRKWNGDIYYNFVKRTHDVIKKADPQARVLVNVTWPGVSGFTTGFLRRGGVNAFDVHTLHNYSPGPITNQEGVLSVHRAIRSFGGKDKEVWFNEGWTYYPTSEDYAAPPLTGRTPPAVAHMVVRCTADLFAAGLEKLITFHIGYGKHGKSWWDWVGSGTEWWDDHGNPTVAVGTYNVLAHHLGLSKFVDTIRPAGAVMHVFQDNRDQRGVIVCWANGKDLTLDLPLDGVIRMDAMGNQEELAAADGKTKLSLTADRRPWYLFTKDGAAADKLAAALKPLHVKPIENGVNGKYVPPQLWEGARVDTPAGNPYVWNGKPLWSLDQVWPDDVKNLANYKPMAWQGTHWTALKHSHGGQPAASCRKGKVSLGCRTGWGGKQKGNKLAALTFYPPIPGSYKVTGAVKASVWSGRGPVTMNLLRLSPAGAEQVAAVKLDVPKGKRDSKTLPLDVKVALTAGERLVLVPSFAHGHSAANFTLEKLAAEHIQESTPAK